MEMTNIHEAKTHFSKLLERVERGEEVIIARAGVPIARLSRFKEEPKYREGGQLRGQIWISPDFDAPLPDDIQRAFEGGGTWGDT